MELMEKKCTNCGTPLAPNEKFCPNCGTPAPAVVEPPKPQPSPEPTAPQPAPVIPQPVPPVQPAPEVQPVQPVQPTPEVQPVQPVQPAPEVQPVPPVQPTPEVQPVPPVQPAPEVQPVPPVQPAPEVQPVPPVQPAPEVQPVQPNVPPPVQPNAPVQPGQPMYQSYPGQGASAGYGQPPYQQGYPNFGAPGGYPGPGYIPTPMNGVNQAPNQGATQPQFVPQPPKKKRTGLIVGLSVGGGVLLLAVIALVLWFVVLGGRLPGTGSVTGVGSGAGIQPGQATSQGRYVESCNDYIDQYEAALSSLTGSDITVERYESDSSDYAMDYVIWQNGSETDVRLCFYDDAYQVMGSDTFDTIIVDSWEVDSMSDFVLDSCTAAMVLTDPDCGGAEAAREQIRQWEEDNGGVDTVQTLNGFTYAFTYLSDGEFSALYVADSDGADYLGGSTSNGDSGTGSGSYSYTSPLGEYVPSQVRTQSGETMTYREYLEQALEASGVDTGSAEAQASLDQNADISFYFHADGTVEMTVGEETSPEGSYEMSGSQVEVVIDGQSQFMEYDGSNDLLTMEDGGVTVELEYYGM